MEIAASTFAPDTASGFLVLEGVNGAGKSTLAKKIAAYVSSCGREVIMTREPGGTALGSIIRDITCDHRAAFSVGALAEALLFSADRAQHVQEVIKPALEQKKLVVCDRYFYSTLAFQGYGRGFDRKALEALCSLAVQDTLPDLVILLDVEPATGLRRNLQTLAKTASADFFEQEDLDFHRRLRAGFLELAAVRTEPFFIADAGQPADAVWTAIKPVLANWVAAC